MEKGTAKTKSVVPLEKEQQKRKCRSFGKGTAKTHVSFLWKRNNKNEKCKSAIPFGKEQQIVKVQKCCSIWKGTTKRKSAKMVFYSKRNSKKWKCRSAMPFGKE